MSEERIKDVIADARGLIETSYNSDPLLLSKLARLTLADDALRREMEAIKQEWWELLETHLEALQGAVKHLGSMPEAQYKVQGSIDFMQTILDPAIRRWADRLDVALKGGDAP